jgi:hypothetical protein
MFESFYQIKAMKILIQAIVLSVILASCSADQTITYTLKDVAFTAEGPLFEGPNTMQYELSNAIGDSLKKAGFTKDQLEKVQLKSASFSTDDSIGFGAFNSIALQLAAQNTPMTNAAVINPIPAGAKNVELTVSKEAELTDFFSQEKIFLVTDANLSKDQESSAQFKANIVFELTVSK